ncbi:Transcriptional regulator, LacI family [metagenome]|uniref:Transcriptional regulator, LacI family n=1 Tax=metagenome TaxID=256318 RepID=A0A2P2C8Q3_9ZZZZ
MADVARRVGVSHQTVSRVLNDSSLVRDDTRDLVLRAIDELGYRRNAAARVLATNRSGRIGMISAHITLHGPSEILSAVNEAGHLAGYDVSLVGLEEVSRSTLRGAVDRMLDEAVEAIVIAVAHQEASETVEDLDLPIPVVVVQGVNSGDSMSAGIDQVFGAATATKHLLDLGHTSIGHVTGPLDWIEARQRRDGWWNALESAGVEPGPELLGDWTAESGYRAACSAAIADGTTALFIANDTMALGVLRALHERGLKVPDDVSIVGFDNLPDSAYYWPALTTVDQDLGRLGREAVDLVTRALSGESDPRADLITPSLIVRSSTALR